MFFKTNYKQLFTYMLFCTMVLPSCKKFVEIDPPPTQITGATVFSNNTSAAGAMTSIYDNMVINGNGITGGVQSIGYLNGLQADELTNYTNNPFYNQFYTNSLTSSSGGSTNYYFWTELYQELYVSNAVIEGLNNSTSLTDSIKQQLMGEAEFMRAFLHFYATNLYGDVPLVTTTNYQLNNLLHRTPQAQVYQQIISDLRDAQSKLNGNFVDYRGISTIERIRPNKWAAAALLARVYLYTDSFTNAEAETSLVINNSSLFNLDSLNGVFLKNSTEAIWQMESPAQNAPSPNTYDAPAYVLTSAPGTGSFNVALSSFLLKSFEPGDQRFNNWVGSFVDPSSNDTFYFPYKYKSYLYDQPVTEYVMVLRLGEQYLIRAEAEANGAGSGITGAINDLNIIRTRANLPAFSGATDQISVLAAIIHERQVELFTEWGHRWFDLKRTNIINAVLGNPGNVCAAKGGTWDPYKELMPIPLEEILINTNLTQNAGY
jgi:starch-binding outer membrane protein, SusD/RagB family